jgi:hypothetical protein
LICKGRGSCVFSVLDGWPALLNSTQSFPPHTLILLPHVHSELRFRSWGAPSLTLFKGGAFALTCRVWRNTPKAPPFNMHQGRGTQLQLQSPGHPRKARICALEKITLCRFFFGCSRSPARYSGHNSQRLTKWSEWKRACPYRLVRCWHGWDMSVRTLAPLSL